jgi:Antitoxin VbhA
MRADLLPSRADRREAVAEALASVRAEGLEPSDAGLRLLEALADGRVTEEQAIARLLQRHRG